MNRVQRKVLHICLELAKLALSPAITIQQGAAIAKAAKIILDVL